ncbi:MAG: ABC transporter ATP-binding protein [Bacteroidetes bacterium]|uniref:ABC transporter ATP-binding protein n=1 Tax=Candidatus Enterocola intestinipullorum TaxID=2840783 RepID=A0A9D9EFK7_9BACT|nr:ABC transporter ATP-binding protein [Candidatus Enterocola intestinipullorum]
MKEVLSLFKRFVGPYKGSAVAVLLFSILTTVLGLFSFAVIVPILEILFGINSQVYELQSLDVPVSGIFDAVKNNLYYYMTVFINENGGTYVLMILAFALVVMTFLKVITYYASSMFMCNIQTHVLRDLRNTLFNKILGLPIGFYSEERKGDIMARMSVDVADVETSIISSIDMLIKNPLMVLINLAVMIAVSWELTLFVLIMLPLSGFIIGQVGKNLKRDSLESAEQVGRLNSQLEETLGGLRIVKAFNAEKKMMSRYAALTEQIRKTIMKVQGRQQLAHPMSEFLGTAIIAIVLCYGGNLILSHSSSGLTAPVFIYYLLLFYSIINPIKELSRASYNVRKGTASLVRIDKILSATNPLVHVESPVHIKEFRSSIEYRNVSFKYSNDYVLRNIDLKIGKGKTVALVGQSGSGKSTLVDLLPRFWDVSEGEILIDGINVKNIELHELRALMGNVNQEAILFNDTFFNNIAFGVENATMEDVVRAAKIANAHDFITATEQGYDTNIGDRGSKLSGGQRQRISIARAILKNPPILILDEATSALDTESEKLVQEALENLMKNRTTIVIAHRLSTIKNADEICVVDHGRIVERGTHAELIALDGVYKKLQQSQSL